MKAGKGKSRWDVESEWKHRVRCSKDIYEGQVAQNLRVRRKDNVLRKISFAHHKALAGLLKEMKSVILPCGKIVP